VTVGQRPCVCRNTRLEYLVAATSNANDLASWKRYELSSTVHGHRRLASIVYIRRRTVRIDPLLQQQQRRRPLRRTTRPFERPDGLFGPIGRSVPIVVRNPTGLAGGNKCIGCGDDIDNGIFIIVIAIIIIVIFLARRRRRRRRVKEDQDAGQQPQQQQEQEGGPSHYAVLRRQLH
jgi:hypothetical protein